MTTTKDLLAKAISDDKEAVMIAIDATRLVDESVKRIQAFPPAAVHLGQALMGVLLVQAMSDTNTDPSSEARDIEKLELQWSVGEGAPFGGLVAETVGQGKVRGTIFKPQAPIQDLKTPLGPGLLQVRRTKTATFTGLVTAQGWVAADLAEYLQSSEQRQCALDLCVRIEWDDKPVNPTFPFRVTHAYGYLLHILPQHSEEKFEAIVASWHRYLTNLGPVSSWAVEENPTAQILKFLSAGKAPKVTAQLHPHFECQCSEERAARALALSYAHIDEETRREQEGLELEIRCEFCGRVYHLADSK